MSRFSWTLLLVASMAGIAAFYPIVKNLDGAIDPYLLALFRFAIATLALLPVMLYTRSLRLPKRKDVFLLTFVAICAVIPTVFMVVGIERASSVVAAILINTNPLIVALLAPLLISEEVKGRKMLGLGIGFLGVVSVVLNGQNPLVQLNVGYVLGSLIILLGAFIASVNKIYARDLVRTYDGLYVTFLSVALGSVFLAVLVALQGGFAELPEFTPQILLSVLAIGITGTAIPWVIWGSSLKHLDVHVAASFNLLIPVFAALYSFLFLNETFTTWMFLGMILTSIGIYIVQREEKIVPAL